MMSQPAAEPTPLELPGAWSALLVSPVSDGWPGVAPRAVAHFGAREEETRWLLAGEPSVVPLVRHGALRLTGADRGAFLHGQVSHDVNGLAVGAARPALLLDHRGRPQAGVSVVRRESDIYLAVDDDRVSHVHRSLDRHIVFDDVAIADLSERIASLVVAGDAALNALAQLLPHGALEATAQTPRQLAWRGADVLVHRRPRGLGLSLDVHLLREHLGAFWVALLSAGVRPVGERALVAARIAAGRASAAFEGVDALPQEAALEGRVSYRKGCYLGQEIMARVEARGTLRRSLARLRLEAAPPEGAAATLDVIDAEGRSVGRVGSAAAGADGIWRALAVVRNDVTNEQRLTALGVDASIEGRVANSLGWD